MQQTRPAGCAAAALLARTLSLAALAAVVQAQSIPTLGEALALASSPQTAEGHKLQAALKQYQIQPEETGLMFTKGAAGDPYSVNLVNQTCPALM